MKARKENLLLKRLDSVLDKVKREPKNDQEFKSSVSTSMEDKDGKQEEDFWQKRKDVNFLRSHLRPEGEKGKLPIENLVLEGGGVLGAAYAGALSELEERGVLSDIKRVGGSSAGAIGSLLLAIGNDSKYINEVLLETKFSDFLDPTEQDREWMDAFLKGAQGDKWQAFKAYQKAETMPEKGIFQGKAFIKWEQDQISAALKKIPGFRKSFEQWRTEKGETDFDLSTVTFGELHRFIEENPECGLRDLYVTASNLDRDQLEIFCHEKTPDVPLYIAVRMSMSFPTAFNVVMYDLYKTGSPERFVDGGLFDNYPMHMFDESQYVPKELKGVFQRIHCNLGTLGLRVDTGEEIARFWNIKNYNNVKDMTAKKTHDQKTIKVEKAGKEKALRHFVAGFYGVGSLKAHKPEEVHHERMEKYYAQRTIQIYNAGIASTNFGIDEAGANALVLNGRKAVNQYFEAHAGEMLPGFRNWKEELQERTIEELVEMAQKCKEIVMEAEQYHPTGDTVDEEIRRELVDNIQAYRQMLYDLQKKIGEHVLAELAIIQEGFESAETKPVLERKGTTRVGLVMPSIKRTPSLLQEEQERQEKMKKFCIFSSDPAYFSEERALVLQGIGQTLDYFIKTVYPSKLAQANMMLLSLIHEYGLETHLIGADKTKLYDKKWVMDPAFIKDHPEVHQKYSDIMKKVEKTKIKITELKQAKGLLVNQLSKIEQYQKEKNEVTSDISSRETKTATAEESKYFDSITTRSRRR